MVGPERVIYDGSVSAGQNADGDELSEKEVSWTLPKFDDYTGVEPLVWSNSESDDVMVMKHLWAQVSTLCQAIIFDDVAAGDLESIGEDREDDTDAMLTERALYRNLSPSDQWNQGIRRVSDVTTDERCYLSAPIEVR